MKVIINPGGNILYKSFYIYALEQIFGRDKIVYSSTPFSGLSVSARNGWGILFVISETKDTDNKRYYISCNDSFRINEEIYDWCDVYGSVNANYALTESKYHAKLVSLCPSFGISCWNIPTTIKHILTDYRIEYGNIKKHIGKYYRMLTTRRFINEYYRSAPQTSDSYIFFCSTLWYSDEWNHNDEGVNLTRANFVRACHDIPNLHFEGGLVPQDHNRSSIDVFSDCLMGGVKISEWLTKTKQSILVFNTPAFWNCHGWKLGEYLALGKCILSTPLSNDLPYPLEHGKNIHFVENSQEAIKESVEYIISHADYQHRLEQGAREYWAKYGTPEMSLKLLGIGK